MFPEPLFDGHFRLLQQRLVGERHLKVMVEPVGGGPLLDGIAFNVDTALWPDNGVARSATGLQARYQRVSRQPQPANYHRQYLANLASSSL
ncbi:single-stranded DNA-specific exonuclease [Escherichia coli]|uniref:Single-stranded DNA-specific exonuclease n=1 Tax=Escherichia coli TaxID=562 RepID=A0A2X3JRU9_ECOLX|nr:single-stranded DNA-specific exonuclease [Escherichia coli]